MAPTAQVHPAPTEIPPDAVFMHIHDVAAMADVTIEPGRAGHAQVTIHVSREDFSNYPAKVVRLVLDPPAPGLLTVDRPAVPMPDRTWQVEAIDLPRSGVWTVKVIVTPEVGAPIMLDAPISINAAQ